MFNGYGYGFNGLQGRNMYIPQPPIPNQGVPQAPLFQNQNLQAQNTVEQKPSLQVPWVNGEVGAQAYLIAPNSSVILMDSDNPIFYIKTSDLSGKAQIQAFKYEEIKAPMQQRTEVSYVTKAEFEEFKESILKGIKTEEKKEEDKI